MPSSVEYLENWKWQTTKKSVQNMKAVHFGTRCIFANYTTQKSFASPNIYHILSIIIPPANFVCGGVYCFHVVRACVCACVCPSVRPSVTFCFFNILKSHCWIFIKPCEHVHICKTNTLDKKVRARGQFY